MEAIREELKNSMNVDAKTQTGFIPGAPVKIS
jgi:hypothetical protein